VNISIEPIKDAGQKFSKKGDELKVLIFQTRNFMDQYFLGGRQQEWKDIQPDLDQSLISIQKASDFLNTLYNDLCEVDSKLN